MNGKYLEQKHNTPKGKLEAKPNLILTKYDFLNQMAQDVLDGLTSNNQKMLPPIYFYDEAGSLLYERITQSPEYYLTRHELSLLHEIQHELPNWVQPTQIVELGNGSSLKTPVLLDSFRCLDCLREYIAIDIDSNTLNNSLNTLHKSYAHLKLTGLAGRFQEAISMLPPLTDHRLYVFLGSTLGNFTPTFQQAFFSFLWQRMEKGNSLLLGFDIQPHKGKSISLIEQAYNDRQEITAQFNLNMLSHINKMLGTNFDTAFWKHQALYNEAQDQIEMYLKSLKDQTIASRHLGRLFHFEAEETILTELSRKFNPDELSAWFENLGFTCLARWTDKAQYCGLLLLQKI